MKIIAPNFEPARKEKGLPRVVVGGAVYKKAVREMKELIRKHNEELEKFEIGNSSTTRKYVR